MTMFKDLFSAHSLDYAKFRPLYPESLFDWLASQPKERHLAWDCGTGNGQAALSLAARFRRVVATDPSAKQIESATPAVNVEYRVAGVEGTGVLEGSVDLITVAQAFHWFPQIAFFREVTRVAKPGGCLAVWCYGLARITNEVDGVVKRLYDDILGQYWESERRLVDEGYRGETFPFEELAAPGFPMLAEWNLHHLVGYLSTWSALRAYIRANATNPLEALHAELARAWGTAEKRQVSWELSLRAFRL